MLFCISLLVNYESKWIRKESTMRHLLVYFARRIVDGTAVYVYTTRKSYQATAKNGSQTESFSVTYWDGKPKEDTAGSGSVTMWLNDKTKEQAYAYRDVYGSEAILVADSDDSFKLMSLEAFNNLSQEDRNIVQPSVFAS